MAAAKVEVVRKSASLWEYGFESRRPHHYPASQGAAGIQAL